MRLVVRFLMISAFLTVTTAAAYPWVLATVVNTPSGKTYRVRKPQRRCIESGCLTYAMFQSPSTMPRVLLTESSHIARELQADALKNGDKAILVIALPNGALNLVYPREGRMFGFVRRPNGRWAAVDGGALAAQYRMIPR